MIASFKLKSTLARLAGNRLIALAALSCLAFQPAWCQADSVVRPKQISADAYVAWWMHDATGYHPAIYLVLQNTSGADLSWKAIKFQGLFRDLKYGYVTVARTEIRQEFHPNQQLYLLLEGPKAFELPIDKNSWPVIEAKVMSRVDSVDDDQATQDVLITKLEQEAMTDEEAKSKLQDYSHPHMLSRRSGTPRTQPLASTQPTAPMVATALPLSGKAPKATRHIHQKDGVSRMVSSARLAGLGQDFYDFEQAFGKPIETRYTPETKWTWAHFEHDHQMTVYAGARSKSSSKVDFVVALVPADSVQQESDLISLGKLFAGKMKSQPLSTPIRTVKYPNSGRIQVTTATAPGYKLFVIAPRGAVGEDGAYVIGVFPMTLQGDPRLVLSENAKRVPMLRHLAPVLADQDTD